MIPGSAPFAPVAPGKTVQRLMEVCRYKDGQAAHSNQVHCSTGPGVHVSGGSSAFLFRDRTAPRQEAWHDSQRRKRRERSRLDRCLAADDRQYRTLALPICVTPRARGKRPWAGPQNERLVTFEPAFSKTRLSDQAGISHPDFFLPVADTRAHRCQ